VTTNIRDPRSIVTPDALKVAPEMLGLPLATPGRRFWGMVIDLAVIGLLTAFVSGWGFLVWGLIGLVMLQLAFRSPGGSWSQGQLGRATAWVFRGSAGCLGIFILFIVLLAWAGTRGDGVDVDADEVRRGFTDAGERIEALADEGGMVTVQGLDDIEELARLLTEETPPTVELTLDSALAAEAGVLSPDDLAAAIEVAAGPDAPDSVDIAGVMMSAETWERALRGRAIELFAEDTVATLSRTATRRADQVEELQVELAEARAEADSGFLGLARDILRQLGSAFGVWTLYFTVATVMLRGRTAGKLITRTRVVRLDGRPLTWLLSLERAGGYAAGLATGLMGFMQVFWDRNRQCVHDRIAGTVVVRDGVAAVPGSWEEVWAADETGNPEEGVGQ